MLLGVVLAAALAFEPPSAPPARVNDYAGLLAAGERTRLEQMIAERERATGVQMVIAIFRSLGEIKLAGRGTPASIEELSIWLGERWRVGQKGLDNGVILVVLVEDRKMRLEVGYGLEPVVPDIVAGQIIAEAIAPRFRERRYAAGLEAAVQAVYARVQGGPRAPAARKARGPSYPVVGMGVLVVIIAIILGLEVNRSRGVVGRRSYTTGGRGWAGPVIVPGPGWGSGGRRDPDNDFSIGGGFSGGGGRFGGGGASGSW